jgi:hypothetical protein
MILITTIIAINKYYNNFIILKDKINHYHHKDIHQVHN